MTTSTTLPLLGLFLAVAAVLVWPTLVDTQPVPQREPRPLGWYTAQARARRYAAAGIVWLDSATTPPGPLMYRTTHPHAAAMFGDARQAPPRRRRPRLDIGPAMPCAPFPQPPRPHLRPVMPVTEEFVVPATLQPQPPTGDDVPPPWQAAVYANPLVGPHPVGYPN